MAAAGGSAAASKSAGASSGGSSAAGAYSGKLQGTDWHIAEVGGQAVSTQSQGTFRIGTDGHVAGSSGCNDFSGTAKVSGHSLHVGPLATTKKSCEPALMSQDQRFFEEIAKVATYAVDEKGDMHLNDASGTTVVRLERAK